jgi:hypothetical protein
VVAGRQYPNFIDRRDGLFRSSREILSRSGPSAAFFTKRIRRSGQSERRPAESDAQWECLSVYTTDCGFVVVSDTEVGVFWAFWED